MHDRLQVQRTEVDLEPPKLQQIKKIHPQIDHNAANYCSQDDPAYQEDVAGCAGEFSEPGESCLTDADQLVFTEGGTERYVFQSCLKSHELGGYLRIAIGMIRAHWNL